MLGRVCVAAVLALAACSPEFDPASRIDKLRVLAIRAEPPEIDPAGVATLTSLVVRGDDSPARTTTVVHFACVPDPRDPAGASPCAAFATLRDPASAVADLVRRSCGGLDAGQRWAPVGLVGIERCASASCGPVASGDAARYPPVLVLPAAFDFPAPSAGAPASAERTLGVQAVVLAFALDATPDELVAGDGTACPSGDVASNLEALWPIREHVLSTKRIAIRGPDSPDAPNENPAVDGIVAGATVLDPAAPTALPPGDVRLAPILPAGPAGQPEVYTTRDSTGAAIETIPEEWVYSWFSTAGELEDLHTRGGDTDRWNVADAGTAKVAVVVRDLRGGTAWAVRDVVFRR